MAPTPAIGAVRMPQTSGVFVTLDRQQHGGTTDCPACLGNATVYSTEFRARFEHCRRRKSLLPCKPNGPVGGEAQASSSCIPPAGVQQARSWISSPAGVRDACNTAPDVSMNAGGTAPLVRQDETMEDSKIARRDHEFREPTPVGSEDFSGKLQSDPEGPQSTEPKDDAETRGDFWLIKGDFIYRHHSEPRVQLYVLEEETFPILPLKKH